MNGIPFPLVAMFVFAVALLTLVQWTLRKLRRTDASLYEQLGRPDLFLNNNVSNVAALWRWVYGRSLTYDGDVGLSSALWALRVGTVLYVIGLLVLFAWMRL